MPAPQFKQQIGGWIEESPGEIGLTFHEDSSIFAGFLTLTVNAKPMPQAEPHGGVHFGPRCARSDDNPGQDIWNLACAARMKAAREDIEKYDNRKLIDEINEAYDEEMEREDKEFAKRTKGYYRRLLSTED